MRSPFSQHIEIPEPLAVPQFGKRGSLYLGGANDCDGARTHTVNEPYRVERNHFPVNNCRGQVSTQQQTRRLGFRTSDT